MAGWSPLGELIHWELVQAREEGRVVDDLAQKSAAMNGATDAQWMALYQEIRDRPVAGDFPFVEPDDPEEIRRQRPPGPRVLETRHTDDVWKDKFEGAWLGRAIGCTLGLPLEVSPFVDGSDGRPGWKNIEFWFRGADAWPIAGYTPRESRAEKEYGMCVRRERNACREDITAMVTDDDIRYTVLGLLLLERHGCDFDAWDVGKLWHECLPYGAVCTAETQAYLNFARVTSHLDSPRPEDWRERIDWVRSHLNPYREWIGAQIRVDALAYAAAGNPELAAHLAWKDASFSHARNGVYGAMFVAAMIAASFVESDPRQLVGIGLSEIPGNCRLACDVRLAVEIAETATSQVDLVKRIEESFRHYFWIHANNNAALIAAALIHGRGDFDLTLTTTVLGGWDTDCNGASVGSIIGAIHGARAIPAAWKSPLNNTLYSGIPGFHPISITECARRSSDVFQRRNR